jgi:hypothetical protein
MCGGAEDADAAGAARMMYILAPVASPFDEVRGQRASD